jgi:hypothetical protein
MTINDEMVERAARALYVLEPIYSHDMHRTLTWDELGEAHRECKREHARAALEAALEGYRLQSAPVIYRTDEPMERAALRAAIEDEAALTGKEE